MMDFVYSVMDAVVAVIIYVLAPLTLTWCVGVELPIGSAAAAAASVDDIVVAAVADVNIDYSDSTYVIDYSHLPLYSVLQYY